MINHRGRVLPVFDLRSHLLPHGDRNAALSDVIAVSVAGMSFGIAAEGVDEAAGLSTHELDEALVTLLDLEALAADPRLRIDDE